MKGWALTKRLDEDAIARLLMAKLRRSPQRKETFHFLEFAMKNAAILMFLALAGAVAAQENVDRQIIESLRALPEALRAEATVFGYDESDDRVLLREGSNGITCWADDPKPNLDEPFYVLCFPKSLEQFLVRNDELKRQGIVDRAAVLEKEIESGKILMPEFDIRYTLRGKRFEEAMALTIIHVPYATAEETGFSAEVDNYRPWLMLEGTPFAHIMIPGH